jgi:hypothetical protein
MAFPQRCRCALLGVHPGTVRLWSNKGLLPVHLTQGGHRRYLRRELELWLASRQGLEPEAMMNSVLQNVRLQVAEGRLNAEPWYARLDETARAQYRQSAHALFRALLVFLADDHGSLAEAQAIGYEYASRARRYGLSCMEAVQAFLFFRSLMIEAILSISHPSNRAVYEMLPKIHTFTDTILLRLLETYQVLENHHG